MSEPTPLDLPVGLRWIKLVYRLGQLVTDSTVDADPHPDLLPKGGTLTLTATPDVVRIQEADGRWRSVDIAGRTYTIRSDGELVDNEGRVGVYIPDPSSLLVEPQGYAVTAAVKPTTGRERRVTIGGSTVLPDVVDLVAVSSVGSVSPSVTSSFDARLYALEQGGGVDVSQAVEDYLTANPPAGTGGSSITADDTPTAPAEGQSASYLVSSAVMWPAGLVWSDDPDGGVAPTIDGTALVSLFTVDGVTRAVMGATFPAPSDTTAPVAGTLAVVPSSTSALGTVTGAADETALAAAPYSFRLGSGAWSAWQAFSFYTWTGLTAETAYTFQHRVRDAAGNITEGAAVTDTTDAPAADSIPPTLGTMTASNISDTGFTVTIAGAVDETALDAAPYAFSTDGGTTWTAYQSSNVYTATGLTAETAYSVNWRVKDAAGNISTGTAQTVTTTAGSPPSSDALSAAILALNPDGYWKLDETSGTQATDYSGNDRHGTYTGTYSLAGDAGLLSLSGAGRVDLGDLDEWSVAGAPGFTVFALGKVDSSFSTNATLAAKYNTGQGEWSLFGYSLKYTSTVWNASATSHVMSEQTGQVIPTGVWHATCMAMPAPAVGARIDHYLDSGTPLAVTQRDIASVVAANGTAPACIGGRDDSTFGWVGGIGHVAIFRTQLNAAQVGALMDAARADGLIP